MKHCVCFYCVEGMELQGSRRIFREEVCCCCGDITNEWMFVEIETNKKECICMDQDDPIYAYFQEKEQIRNCSEQLSDISNILINCENVPEDLVVNLCDIREKINKIIIRMRVGQLSPEQVKEMEK